MLYKIIKYPIKIICVVLATLFIWLPIFLMMCSDELSGGTFEKFCEGIEDWYKISWKSV